MKLHIVQRMTLGIMTRARHESRVPFDPNRGARPAAKRQGEIADAAVKIEHL